MNQQQIYQWIKHPECLNKETLYELRTLLARYPYFQTARLLYLKNLYLLHDISFGEELRKSALYVIDRRKLFSLIEGERYTLKELQRQVVENDVPGVDRTLSLIDAFLSAEQEESDRPVSMMTVPMDATTDYMAYLMQQPDAESEPEQEESRMKGQEWIDQFLETSTDEPIKVSESTVEETEEEEMEEESDPEIPLEESEDESYFTETLAKIYVKQQRYSKALEIIKKLNLKYPKKNAYFADQIRFLEKLIINTKSK